MAEDNCRTLYIEQMREEGGREKEDSLRWRRSQLAISKDKSLIEIASRIHLRNALVFAAAA